MKFSTRDLCFCAIGAALIAVCAWISIPAEVPFTLQTFAIFTVCGLLGGKRGTVSVLVYLLLGAVGAPVFAGFRGGFASLLGTTGGYLVGFVLLTLIITFAQAHWGQGQWVFVLSAAVGLLVCYAFGTAWFLIVYTRTGAITLGVVLAKCVLPFCCRTRSSSHWRRCCVRGCTGASPRDKAPVRRKTPAETAGVFCSVLFCFRKAQFQ